MTIEQTLTGLPPKTVARSLVTVLKQGSSQIGLTEGAWFKFVDPKNLGQGLDERVPIKDYLKMWDSVLDITGDQSLGLKIGDSSSPDIGLLGALVFHCATLREIAHQICRYQNMMSDLIQMQLEEKNGQTILTCKTIGFDEDLPQVIDQGLAFFISWMRQFSKIALNPVEVRFQHSMTSYINITRDVFLSPIHFDQAHSAILFSTEQLNIAIPDHDASLKEFMLSNSLLAAAPNDAIPDFFEASKLDADAFSTQVRALIKTYMPMGRIGADLIAKDMKISRQTLYRKLKDESITFLELLEDERQSTAIQLLSDAKLTMSEIAILLGFSEPKSFRRAFKRWQGMSPKAFRDRL